MMFRWTPGLKAPRARLLVAVGWGALLAGCVVVPRTTEFYDADCHINTRHMRLETVEVGVLGRCSNEGCATALVVIGATAAASAVVSGSIVVVGNVVYWLEKQGRCMRAPEPARP